MRITALYPARPTRPETPQSARSALERSGPARVAAAGDHLGRTIFDRRPLEPDLISDTDDDSQPLPRGVRGEASKLPLKIRFRSPLDTLASIATDSTAGALGGWTMTVPVGSCSAGTGSLPARHMRHAVCSAKPFAFAHAESFIFC